MFELSQINKSFKSDFWKSDVAALKDLSFTVNKGTLCGFLGANGAGKTTSIKILMKFIKANSGTVKFDEEMGIDFNEIRGNIGFVPERPYFYPHLTGRELLRYMGKLSLLSSSEITNGIETWPDRFSIKHALDKKIHGYSKGMLQRLGFSCALMHDPKLLILDEPLGGLDPLGRQEFKDVMVELNKSGKTVFFSSHIVSDVEEICNEIVVLEHGELLYQGKVDDLIEKNLESNTIIKFKPNSNDCSIKGAKLLSEDVWMVKLEKEKVQSNLKLILDDKSVDLISVQPERPTLERIIYNIREK